LDGPAFLPKLACKFCGGATMLLKQCEAALQQALKLAVSIRCMASPFSRPVRPRAERKRGLLASSPMPAALIYSSPLANMEFDASLFFQAADNAEEIAGLRIAAWPEDTEGSSAVCRSLRQASQSRLLH